MEPHLDTRGPAVDTDRTGGSTPAVDDARAALASTGVCFMPPETVLASLGADGPRRPEWAAFAAHWEDLAEDPYAAQRGTRRLRRYGHFAWDSATGCVRMLPHEVFVQPDHTNPLYDAVDRHFEPLTRAFADDPVLRSLLGLLGRMARALDGAGEWSVKVHPFRVVATADGAGEPTPEGRHRDGVTLVSSLLVARNNVSGGESTVFTPEGRQLLSTTLRDPGSLLLNDDRATLHGVSAVRPVDPARPAHRDVLVTTFTAA
ncbi:2OG-Fe dioxygenase family protein [Streptomyces sp. PKU-EA00015]|uniref:2OG-Fe dioxygenase family protein n=1 Tax=Streptomyces sp. PKU-EA00015 TaxID=2748326 RepID=UPI0015A43AAA|nr:2OG-Fe dioxygenase family protein [Streptomyces sp. PKU-EA00015]NWF29033.1 2OG-Fe dioxygenase family protein [Streptomyces sp. PKU-EA00015]